MKRLLEKLLPLYIPNNRAHTVKLHLAIWNCGTRPQTLKQALKDIRITIRRDGEPIYVIKKGAIWRENRSLRLTEEYRQQPKEEYRNGSVYCGECGSKLRKDEPAD